MTHSLRKLLWLLPPIFLILGILGWIFLRPFLFTLPRLARLGEFFKEPPAHADWRIPAGSQCSGAPFQFPTTGYVGFYRGDSFSPFKLHSGLDIFGGSQPGETPIYAAYPGYLTRRAEWKSTVIIRIPSDPLQPGRQIWAYYTHMADPDGNSLIDAAFPPGSSEIPVTAGTLLGLMGNFSGTPGSPTGVHLHFSIVLDNGKGSFHDERYVVYTLDPSPYFGRSFQTTQNLTPPPPCQ